MSWSADVLLPARIVRLVSVVLLYAFVLAASLEFAVEIIMRYPQAVPILFRPASHVNHIKNYYLGFDRSIVQMRSDCAVYDDKLTYRLRPGACTVSNRESTVESAVNRSGLRDSEDKLNNHSILVLGDSHAMGWGVARVATLSERLGALTGRDVLNAAISSYETAREMELLREVVRPATEYVVIAYCDNDYLDNWAFVRGGSLPRKERADYEAIVEIHERTTRYYPFKHIRNLGKLVWASARASLSALRPGRQSPASSSDPQTIPLRPGFAAMNFIAIVESHRDLLRGRHLIVFDVNPYNKNSGDFAAALRRAAGQSALLSDVISMHVVDTSTFLTDEDYFLIDDHMTAAGHEKVARSLAEIVQGEKRWRVEADVDPSPPVLDGFNGGQTELVERKGELTLIWGWAARDDTGEPAAVVALLRDGATIAETEPVHFRSDIATALAKPSAARSGFTLAIPSDLVDVRTAQVVATWANGTHRILSQPPVVNR